MKELLKWERLAHDDSGDIKTDWQDTYRARVPGGWLVAIWATVERDVTGTPKGQVAPATNTTVAAGRRIPDGYWGGGLTFVPDPTREWDPVLYKDRNSAKSGGEQT
ncbi:hypothetical protein [Sorangium sp. So ce1000]|uniref:hypothetical protein n=1 Tax=Sorangium sp. So ce1000 TaxID=3133325 RepID=UPI003F5DC8E7